MKCLAVAAEDAGKNEILVKYRLDGNLLKFFLKAFTHICTFWVYLSYSKHYHKEKN